MLSLRRALRRRSRQSYSAHRLFPMSVADKGGGGVGVGGAGVATSAGAGAGGAAGEPVPVTPRERFMFDLNGFLVVRGVFGADEVAAANAAIDDHLDCVRPRDATLLRNAPPDGAHAAPKPRMDLGGMLRWDKSDVFRSVLCHPRLAPYLIALLGDGYRLDHLPMCILQDSDSEGFTLHGGPLSGDDGVPEGRFNPELQYRCVNGQPWTSLLAVSVVLADHGPGAGGFCVVRGSHKLNLPLPKEMASGHVSDFSDEHVHQPVTRAGDVVLFAEATIHGALPWRASHQRRIALYRFCPANMGYGRGHYELTDEQLADFTPLQRAVLAPPYATRLERPMVTMAALRTGEPELKERSAEKKALDKALFGTTYF